MAASEAWRPKLFKAAYLAGSVVSTIVWPIALSWAGLGFKALRLICSNIKCLDRKTCDHDPEGNVNFNCKLHSPPPEFASTACYCENDNLDLRSKVPGGVSDSSQTVRCSIKETASFYRGRRHRSWKTLQVVDTCDAINFNLRRSSMATARPPRLKDAKSNIISQ